MASKFKKAERVRLKSAVPEGPVHGMRMDNDGNVQYQIRWTDTEGQVQERWFDEDQLEGVPE